MAMTRGDPPTETLDERFELRLSSNEKEELKQRSRELGLSTSAYARLVLKYRIPRAIFYSDIQAYSILGKIYGQLGRIGERLGQPTNSEREDPGDLLAQLKPLLINLQQQISQLRSQMFDPP